MESNTLFLIPCCKRKRPNGKPYQHSEEPLAGLVSKQCYGDLCEARYQLLGKVKSEWVSKKGYEKNKMICDGLDFGKESHAGAYFEAIKRYTGTLYSVPNFYKTIHQALQIGNTQHILILSALYGPLHPLSLIQDYNLKMNDKPASETWMKSLAPFLKEYITTNGIRSVNLYFGKSTKYLRVAKAALLPLIKSGEIKASHYDVVGGSTRETPRCHGIRLLSDLGQQSESVCSKKINEIPVGF